MHIKVPFLAVLFITIFQLTVYGLQNNAHSTKDFDDVLTVNQDDISEIQMSDLSGRVHRTKDPKQMNDIIDFFNQFQYQRLRDDQTSYMPMKTMMITIHDEDQTVFIIPYGEEILINHKVYKIKNGSIEQDELLDLLDALQKK